MWRYLKYFVPIILSIIVIAGAFFYPLVDEVDIEEMYRVSLVLACAFFGAIWFLFLTKPSHKFTVPIAGGLFLFVLPIIIIIVDLDRNFFVAELITDNDNFRFIYFNLVQVGLGVLYCLRFYSKDRQDIFSLLKLLLILTTLILSIIIFSDALEDNVLENIGITVVILIILSSLLHMLDMIIWEKNRIKSSEETDPFDALIDQISGTS